MVRARGIPSATWTRLGAITLLAGTLALSTAGQAQLVIDPTKIPSGPGIDSYTENVDFGDIDLDGDGDVALADGG